MRKYNRQLKSGSESEGEEDLDIPTFLRAREKRHAVLDHCRAASRQERRPGVKRPGREAADREEGLELLIQRINNRLDHPYATIETVVSINDLVRYGLPRGIARQLFPLVCDGCKEGWVVGAFLYKLARHPDYEPLLSPRVQRLIQDYVHGQGVSCVQLEPCIQPIVYKQG